MAAATRKTFGVQGFHCTGCADNLGKALHRIDGVVRAQADFEKGEVEVRFDPERVSDDVIRDGIRTAGFEAV
ncbi:MAG: heavy-metal-associated domain-containing protein [Haloechinothrix sp.]